MLAVTGPVAGSKHSFGGLLQAGPERVQVHGLKAEQPARELPMTARALRWRDKGAERRDPQLKPAIDRQVEVKGGRCLGSRSLHHVDP